MNTFKVKDPSLAEQGTTLIEWAENRMPVLKKIEEDFEKSKPLEGFRIGACLHVTTETAVLAKVLLAGGAKVALCGSNPLSTQDEVAAALAREGVNVYAWRGETTEEYYWCINTVIDWSPSITVDDGADLVSTIHTKRVDVLNKVKGGTEETTTGVNRLKEMAKAGTLKYPIIAVNDAYTKYLFDNRYGTGQSTIDGIVRATNILLAGKNFVVCGYGWCGRGLALRARGMGANVTITEIDPIKALEAIMDGFRVMPLEKALNSGDIFVTVTGNLNVIRKEHLLQMKDGSILANSGHFNLEINIKDLQSISRSTRFVRTNLDEYTLLNGRKLFLLAQGRLVNLAAAEGHPSEVMDMSFANQALCIKHIVQEQELQSQVYPVPDKIDRYVARVKLMAMGVEIDELTDEQKNYITSWEIGTR